MSAKHTPGPWKTRKGFLSHEIEIFSPNPEIKKPFYPAELAVVKIDDDTKETIAESKANARLIAAAPDLLEALEYAVKCGMVPTTSKKDGGAAKYSQQVEVADMIRAAIAKATGKEEA